MPLGLGRGLCGNSIFGVVDCRWSCGLSIDQVGDALPTVALVLPPMLLITTVVFAPGRYRFLDVLRYGWPLSLVYAVVVPALVLWLG